jgi:transcriptional regulator with XRE-family HTH domain
MKKPDAFYASVGRRIQDLRRTRGFTQEHLGSLISPAVTRASIANIEAGKQGILIHTFVQLALGLGVAPQDLFPEKFAAENPALKGQVQDELTKKLSVPVEASRRLTEKLFARPKERRRTNERSTRTSRR